MNDILIKKYSGELVPFEPQKLENSLFKAGASPELIAQILDKVKLTLKEGVSTREIYKKAYAELRKSSLALAGRYKLKKAIMELGPSGYPFESFVGHLFSYQGFNVEVGITLNGKCVTHEVDVWAEKENLVYFMECKYHSRPTYKSDVKVALYVHSRFNDLVAAYKNPEHKTFAGWLVCNTSFTSDAVQYAECSGLKVMSWNYPDKGSLKDRIEISGLYPISCLATLTQKEKQILLSEDIVLCKELLNSPHALELIDPKKRHKVIEECESII